MSQNVYIFDDSYDIRLLSRSSHGVLFRYNKDSRMTTILQRRDGMTPLPISYKDYKESRDMFTLEYGSDILELFDIVDKSEEFKVIPSSGAYREVFCKTFDEAIEVI